MSQGKVPTISIALTRLVWLLKKVQQSRAEFKSVPTEFATAFDDAEKKLSDYVLKCVESAYYVWAASEPFSV